MTTWKDGGPYGNYSHEVTDETGRQSICHVRTRCNKYAEDSDRRKWTIVSWPKGEANFALILQAPRMLEALEEIAKGAIVSPEQPPEKIAEQVLRVLQLAREDCVKSLEFIGAQQRRAERAEAALEEIAALDLGACDQCKEIALAAIAAVKGEDDELA